MKAQILYDLRQATGFASGLELHQMFEVLLGDPSPPGSVDISRTQLQMHPTGKKSLTELSRTMETVLSDDDTRDYMLA